jgi:ABC-2 type transport system permease protein
MIQDFSKFAFEVIQLGRIELMQRYKRTLLGLWWSLLTPIIAIAVYFFAFSQLIIIEGVSGKKYLIYLVSGVIVLHYSVQTLISIAESFSNKVNLITRIRINPFLLSAGVLASSFFSFFVTLLPLIAMLYYEDMISTRLLFLFPLLISLTYFLYGMGLLLAILFTLFDDAKAIIKIMISFLPFITPVFYSLEQLPRTFAQLVLINPLTIFLTLIRWTVGLPIALDSQFFALILLYLLLARLAFVLFRRSWGKLVTFL